MYDAKNSRWKIFTNQIRNKYRLVILNDDSFAEKFSLRLSPLGLMILFGSITIIMTFLVISLVAFTPLREYIPGYDNVNDHKEIIRLHTKTETLEKTLNAREWYVTNFLNVLAGKTEGKTPKPKQDTTGKYTNINIKPSENDLKLRNDIENNLLESTSDKVSANKIDALSNFFFFTPVQGIISNSYNIREGRLGSDILSKENEFVKSTLDGTIIFAGLTATDGYVIQIQHGNNINSVYKHLSNLLKNAGDFVKAGEPIGVVGTTDQNSNSPHLRFEIWYNGFAINPQDYVVY